MPFDLQPLVTGSDVQILRPGAEFLKPMIEKHNTGRKEGTIFAFRVIARTILFLYRVRHAMPCRIPKNQTAAWTLPSVLTPTPARRASSWG